MSKIEMLRCLVNERLTAAAEEIFALFERTIAEYEEEVCRSKEENTRKQQLLDSVVGPRVLLHRAGVQIHLMSAAPSLNQEIIETPQIKEEPEEQSIKQEDQLQEFTAVSVKSEEQSSLLQQRQSEHREETQGEECGGAEADLDPHGLLHIDTFPGVQIHLMSAGPSLNQEIRETLEEPENQKIKQEEEQLQEFTAVSVKSEEQSSLLQQRQSEHQEETQGEECGGAEADLNPHGLLHSETEEHTDNNEDWEPPASSSTQQMETEADGDYYNQVTSFQNSNPISHFKSSPETSDTVKDCECSICKKRFRSKSKLQRHTRVHTGEKPYSCSICKKTFTQKIHSERHMSIHKEEKPDSCAICKKIFTQKSNVKKHIRTHTHSCSKCDKIFTRKDNLKKHMKIHIGEKPFSCSICQKTFTHNTSLKIHMRTHTGEKPYSCSVCQSTFTQRGSLIKHMTRYHK